MDKIPPTWYNNMTHFTYLTEDIAFFLEKPKDKVVFVQSLKKYFH